MNEGSKSTRHKRPNSHSPGMCWFPFPSFTELKWNFLHSFDSSLAFLHTDCFMNFCYIVTFLLFNKLPLVRLKEEIQEY